MKLQSGHDVIELSREEEEEQKKLFKAYSVGLITLRPGNWFLTKPFLDVADKFYNFKFRPTDTVIMTFPKCGTTWMQEIVWNLRHPTNVDNPTLVSVNTRCPFIDGDFVANTPNIPPMSPDNDTAQYFAKYCPGKDPKDGVFIPLADNLPDPRIIKTHLPFSLLTPNMLDVCKVVFVARNPKDACVSFHHHSRIIRAHDYVGDFNTFFDLFINDKVLYAPYWKFLEEGWEHCEHPNFHLVHFEDLKADPVKEISRLNAFLQTGCDEQTLKKIVEVTSFKKMKERDSFKGGPDVENPFVNAKLGSFFRAGEAGSWKQEISKEQSERMDEWIRANTKDGRVIVPKFGKH